MPCPTTIDGVLLRVRGAFGSQLGGSDLWDTALWDTGVWGGDEPLWVDITDYVKRVQIDRGTDDFLQRPRTGSAVVILENIDGTWLTPGGAPGELDFRPGSKVQVQVQAGAGTAWRNLFTGRVDTMQDRLDRSGRSTTEVVCYDALGELGAISNPQQPLQGDGDSYSERMNRILDEAGWPAGDRVLATGLHTFQARTLAGSLLNEFHLTADSEGGLGYANPSNDVVTLGQAWRDQPRSAEVQDTYGHAAGMLCPSGVFPARRSLQSVINEATFARAGTGPQQLDGHQYSFSIDNSIPSAVAPGNGNAIINSARTAMNVSKRFQAPDGSLAPSWRQWWSGAGPGRMAPGDIVRIYNSADDRIYAEYSIDDLTARTNYVQLWITLLELGSGGEPDMTSGTHAVRWTIDANSGQRVSVDAQSQALYGRRTYRRLDLVCRNDTQAQTLADNVVARRAEIVPTLHALEFRPSSISDVERLTERRIADRVRYEYVNPIRPWGFVFESHLMGVRHVLGPREPWVVSYRLDDALLGEPPPPPEPPPDPLELGEWVLITSNSPNATPDPGEILNVRGRGEQYRISNTDADSNVYDFSLLPVPVFMYLEHIAGNAWAKYEVSGVTVPGTYSELETVLVGTFGDLPVAAGDRIRVWFEPITTGAGARSMRAIDQFLEPRYRFRIHDHPDLARKGQIRIGALDDEVLWMHRRDADGTIREDLEVDAHYPFDLFVIDGDEWCLYECSNIEDVGNRYRLAVRLKYRTRGFSYPLSGKQTIVALRRG